MMNQLKQTPQHDHTTTLKATRRPLSVTLVDPHTNPGFWCFVTSLLTGAIFGTNQPINLTIVYAHAVRAEASGGLVTIANAYDIAMLYTIATIPCAIHIVDRINPNTAAAAQNDVYYKSADLIIFTMSAVELYEEEMGVFAQQFVGVMGDAFTKDRANLKILVCPGVQQSTTTIINFCTTIRNKMVQNDLKYPTTAYHQIQGIALPDMMLFKTALVMGVNDLLYEMKQDQTCATTLPYLKNTNLINLYTTESSNNNNNTTTKPTTYALSNVQLIDYPTLGHITPLALVLSTVDQYKAQNKNNTTFQQKFSRTVLNRDSPPQHATPTAYNAVLSSALTQHLQLWLGMTPRGSFTNIITQAEGVYKINNNNTTPTTVQPGEFANLPVMTYYGNVGVMKTLLSHEVAKL